MDGQLCGYGKVVNLGMESLMVFILICV